MKVSLNQVKQYIDFELPPVNELVSRINQQLGGVEEIIDLNAKYKDAVIVKVVSAVDHENSDHLHVCMVDDGGVVEDVDRSESGLVQVVCGAANVHSDMWAVWLPPRATVPASFEDDDPFVLDVRNLRGVKSSGMLAAHDEMAIGAEHSGIIEITESDLPAEETLSAGANFAKMFGLNDTVIDIENKMFTHRPDCFGQLGVAREIAGILGHKFVSPKWYLDIPEFASGEGLELEVFNEASEKVPRFMAVAMKDVVIKPSPLWLQCALVAMGSKPINNIVDITNYVMLMTAQPTHAYDYDKIRGKRIGARMARDGEKVTLLNDKTYELTSDDIVIADGEGVIGLAGIMGGGNSEVSSETKNIILEVATFDMYTLRKSSMRHGIFTDALTRFNKGQSPLQNDRIINLLMTSIKDVSEATQAGPVSDLIDESLSKAYDSRSIHGTLSLTPDFINERLGLKLSLDEIESLLDNVHFAVFGESDKMQCTAPFWRTDIELPEDIVEEVGRLYGFDKLPRELPLRSTAPAAQNPSRLLKQNIRSAMEKIGASEVLTYSFVHEKIIKSAGQNPDQAFRLGNALSPDLQYYRLSVLPSLLDKVHMNIKSGHDEFVLYEIGKGHQKDLVDADSLPLEMTMLDAVHACKKPRQGAAFYRMRASVEQLGRELGILLSFKAISDMPSGENYAPFEAARSAFIVTKAGDIIGVVGELKQTVIRAFKLPEYTAAMTIDFARLLAVKSAAAKSYRPLSRYPSVTQDVSLKVAADVTFEHVFSMAVYSLKDVSDIDIELSPVFIYQAEDDTSSKTITLRLRATSQDRTLRDDEVKTLIDFIARSLDQIMDLQLADVS